MKKLKFWRFDDAIYEFWAYFHCACAETPIYELPVKKWYNSLRASGQLRGQFYEEISGTENEYMMIIKFMFNVAAITWMMSDSIICTG